MKDSDGTKAHRPISKRTIYGVAPLTLRAICSILSLAARELAEHMYDDKDSEQSQALGMAIRGLLDVQNLVRFVDTSDKATDPPEVDAIMRRIHNEKH
jgi:hypothetical protein